MWSTVFSIVGKLALAILFIALVVGLAILAGPYVPSVTEASICQP
jgi:hypothetical protein